MYSHTWLAALALLPVALSAPNDHLHGTFSSPSSQTRLKFRYWLPDASVNTSVVQSDIHSASSIGAGGIELLPLYNYGASLAPPPEGADWATYGFGTSAFNEVFKSAMQAARDAGMVFDFAFGANQGQGVPAVFGDGGLQWDLAPFNATITNGTFTGQIPGWGTGDLIGLISAEVLSSSIIMNPASETFSTPSTNSTRLVLRSSSLTDHTEQVTEDGTVNLHFNTTSPTSTPSSSNPEYRLFAYYQYQTHTKNLDIQTNTTGTIFDNGSYTVDHFSSHGAQTTIGFWEKYILNDTETRGLLSEVGRYAWEDSLEIKSNISWTPSLPTLFKEVTGYELRMYLPLIMFGNNNPGVQPSYPGTIQCILDTPDSGTGILNDYRKTLAKGYQSYLDTLTTWAESLGLEYSAQPSYNLPLDMESSIPHITVPECESLAFQDNIDGYRQFSGVANVAGQNTISNEMGGDLRKSFRLTVSNLLWQINTAFAGGINMVVLHGQTYSGNYYDTTWPGYTAFFMLFSDSYNDKQPAWRTSYPEAIGYVSRVQWVLHQGLQKSDVAFYNKASVTDPMFATIYQGGDLVERGYTYSYLSPDNLNLSSMVVTDGVLANSGPGYRAIVVTSEQNVTLHAVNKLQDFADDGLPVILAGGLPGYYPFGTNFESQKDKKAVNAALQTLQSSKNVYTIGATDIAERLEFLNVYPRVSVETNGTWYPVYRTDNETGTEHVFLFSDSPSTSTGSITIHSTKKPYTFNAWNGQRTSVLQYTFNNKTGTTTIPVTLASNQTAIFALSDDLSDEIDTPSTHAISLPESVMGYNYTAARGLALHISPSSSTSTSASNTTQGVHFANGKVHSLTQIKSSTNTSPMNLSNWTLQAEHWSAPSNLSAAHIPANKYNTTHSLSSCGAKLPSWLEIPGLRNVSGVGYYSTSFTWSPDMNGTEAEAGAYISLPPSSHGLMVYINGHKISGVDFANPTANIGPFLIAGKNKVEVVVPTVMWNYIKTLYPNIEIAGSDPLLSTTGSLPSDVETGLIGVVRILPYVVSWVDI
ncbi:uncharacterized protein BDV14DRAFT_205135 [Aspergillus stella-maris]|uniref:uncharacterized protein n=1 Tax=Aspergillus stella-maris TaxID=1810926 RepID=UPI003CCD8EA7